jgi:phospholipase/carboxylesterase
LTILSGPTRAPAAGGKPRQLIVLCHGAGARGDQLMNFAGNVGKALPHALFIAPNGPVEADVGMGRQWFPLHDRRPAALAAGARQTGIALNAFIDAALEEHKIQDYALAGFSQGAMMVLQIGPRRAVAPRGIVALSGALLDPFTLPAELRNRAPVMLGHGEEDPVVPAYLSRNAAASLQENDIPVELVIVPGLKHGIDEHVLIPATKFLQRAFA